MTAPPGTTLREMSFMAKASSRTMEVRPRVEDVLVLWDHRQRHCGSGHSESLMHCAVTRARLGVQEQPEPRGALRWPKLVGLCLFGRNSSGCAAVMSVSNCTGSLVHCQRSCPLLTRPSPIQLQHVVIQEWHPALRGW
jgi:hypothetical protein